jgi:succinate-acetate transporter protein
MSTDIEKSATVDTAPNQYYQAPPPKPVTHRIANPATLGLFSFASTTFILSMYNAQTRHITTPNAVIGMACFCGGLAQFLAGMWEFPRNNTFGAAAFTSYGAFWMSFATIFIPGSGIIAAYEDKTEFASALGIYLITWMFVTFFFFIYSLRTHLGFVILFGLLTTTFGCLVGGQWAGSEGAAKAGGIIGVLTALTAYYIGLADLLATQANPIFVLPLGHWISGGDKKRN